MRCNSAYDGRRSRDKANRHSRLAIFGNPRTRGVLVFDGGDVVTNRERFEAHYRKVDGCLLPAVKEKHWGTWLAAQVALLESHGPAVEIRVLDEEKAE